MQTTNKIAEVSVKGLQGIFNYDLRFKANFDTIIIIAPNGSGKTALLSLIKDCMSLNLRKISSHVFDEMKITFVDGFRWEFSKTPEGGKLKYPDKDRLLFGDLPYDPPFRAATKSHESYVGAVTFKRFDPAGDELPQSLPDVSALNPRMISRIMNRVPYLSATASGRVRDLRSGESLSPIDAFYEHFHELSHEPEILEMLSIANPSAAWPGTDPVACLFIETQRLLYSREKTIEGDKATSQEEILRQAQSLAALLQKNYSDYAATSQGLDRTFPHRLIARSRSGGAIDARKLVAELLDVERRRAALTEAGILIEQSDAIVSTDGDLSSKVLDALQVYVEDSQKKLSTYDEIYPKTSVFLDLMNAKLRPKKLMIGREFGASIWRGDQKLDLTGLSSGEKHEFIMLFKLIFETKPNSLVLIDEPEISLHVVWQLEFMQDLRSIQGANPFQSIIATHSPQIFQGFQHLLVDLADQTS